MLLREIKNVFHLELDAFYQKEEVDSFFYLLIEHFLDLERFVLTIGPNLIISKEDEKPLFEALNRLRLHEPVQYITGTSHFMELEFTVNKNVLIPRPETEELVRWIIEDVGSSGCKVQNTKALRILDVGTGSGCIAIALAKYLSGAKVFALDVSSAALDVAKENAALNEVGVVFMNEDILELESLDFEFDILVSNPPYVRELEKKEMHENVLEHEPHRALFVSDDHPLLFYKKITELAANSLNEGGRLYFEINQYLGKETQQLLREHNFSEIELRKDMYGNHRMLKGEKKDIASISTEMKDADSN